MDQEKKGVALQYGAMAPKVVAVARGRLVEKLLEIARAHNITVVEDSDLAEVLSKLNAGAEIPQELFTAVSEILTYCYRVNGEFRKKMKSVGF